MIYHVYYRDRFMAQLQSWDGVIRNASRDEGHYQWTAGKKVEAVIKWITEHGQEWRIPEPVAAHSPPIGRL